MPIFTNSGLVMAMQSALATPATLTSISKAASGVFTGTHALVAGDYVLIKAQGMIEVDYRVLEVLSVSTTVSFQVVGPDGLTGLDTTGYTTFTSGTAEKITFGTSISGVQGFTSSGGDIKFVPTTTVHDKRDKQIVVGANALSYNLDLQWDPANVGQVEMFKAFEARLSKAFRITWPNGAYAAWFGSVGYSGAPGGESQGVTTTNAAIALDGPLTVAGQ